MRSQEDVHWDCTYREIDIPAAWSITRTARTFNVADFLLIGGVKCEFWLPSAFPAESDTMGKELFSVLRQDSLRLNTCV